MHDIGARIIGTLSFIGILISFGVYTNPMLTGEPVGGMVFNTILLGYGIPAILMAILARQIRNTRPALVYRIAAVTAIVLALVYLLGGAHDLPRTGADRPADHRRRAVHLLGGGGSPSVCCCCSAASR